MSIDVQDIFSALEKNQVNPLFEQVSYAQVSKEALSPLDNLDNNQKPGDIIQEAQQEVLIQGIKFEVPSEGYDNINQALIVLRDQAAKDKKPRVVNMLINSRGILAEKFFKPNDATNLRSCFPENTDTFKINIVYHQAEAFGSYHSKLVIVDGKKAIVRGADPSKSNAAGSGFIETGMLIDSDFSQEVRNDFVRSWNKYCSPHQRITTSVPEVASPPPHTHELSGDKNKIPIAFLSKKANGNVFRYTNYEGPFKVAFLKAIELSQKSINILTPNINDPEVLIALAVACNRGVKVNIAISKTFNEEREVLLGGTNTQSIMLLAQMINPSQLDNLDVRWSTKKDGTISERQGSGSIHGKSACFDEKIVITGSSPLDIQGTQYSKEADIIFQDEEKTREFNNKLFENKFKTGKDFKLHAYETVVNLIKEAVPSIDISAYSGSYAEQSIALSQHPLLKQTLTPDAYRKLMDKINDELNLMGVRSSKPVEVSDVLYEQRKRIVVYALIGAAILLATTFSGGIAMPIIAGIIGIAALMCTEGKNIQQYMSKAKPAEITVSKYFKKDAQTQPAELNPISDAASNEKPSKP